MQNTVQVNLKNWLEGFNASLWTQESEIDVRLLDYIPSIEELYGKQTWEEQNEAFIEEANGMGFTVRSFDPKTKGWSEQRGGGSSLTKEARFTQRLYENNLTAEQREAVLKALLEYVEAQNGGK